MMVKSAWKIAIKALLREAKLPQPSVAIPVWITPETAESTKFNEFLKADATLCISHVNSARILSGRLCWKAFSARRFAPCLSITDILTRVGKFCSKRNSSGTTCSVERRDLNSVSPLVVSKT